MNRKMIKRLSRLFPSNKETFTGETRDNKIDIHSVYTGRVEEVVQGSIHVVFMNLMLTKF